MLYYKLRSDHTKASFTIKTDFRLVKISFFKYELKINAYLKQLLK